MGSRQAIHVLEFRPTETQATSAVDGSILPPTSDRDDMFLAPDVPGYRIVRELGRGGAGIVYLAWEEALDRFIALKTLLPHYLHEGGCERFENEALALARVQHQNVVPVHAFGRVETTPYLAMQYVLGDTLADALDGARGKGTSHLSDWFTRRGDRRLHTAAWVVATALADALDDVHRAGLIHRDIKPANVVIDAKGRPTLVDFGLACDPESHRLAPGSGSAGTPRYMAPEQIDAPSEEIDGRADTYALGLLLFEMLTLRPAFPQQDLNELVDAITLGDLPSPRSIDPEIPVALDQIVQKATATRPADRYQSAKGLRHALLAAAHQLKIDGLSSLSLGPELQRSLEPGRSPDHTNAAPTNEDPGTLKELALWLIAWAGAVAIAFFSGQ